MIRVVHRGSPRTAEALASCLRQEGLEANYPPVSEYRGGIESVPEQVVMAVVGGVGADVLKAAAKRGIEKFRERFPRVEVSIWED
jgi:hypothetical protein